MPPNAVLRSAYDGELVEQHTSNDNSAMTKSCSNDQDHIIRNLENQLVELKIELANSKSSEDLLKFELIKMKRSFAALQKKYEEVTHSHHNDDPPNRDEIDLYRSQSCTYVGGRSDIKQSEPKKHIGSRSIPVESHSQSIPVEHPTRECSKFNRGPPSCASAMNMFFNDDEPSDDESENETPQRTPETVGHSRKNARPDDGSRTARMPTKPSCASAIGLMSEMLSDTDLSAHSATVVGASNGSTINGIVSNEASGNDDEWGFYPLPEEG